MGRHYYKEEGCFLICTRNSKQSSWIDKKTIFSVAGTTLAFASFNTIFDFSGFSAEEAFLPTFMMTSEVGNGLFATTTAKAAE